MKKLLVALSCIVATTTIIGCSTIKDVFTKPSPAFLSLEDANKQISDATICCSGDIFNSPIYNVTKTIDEDFNIDSENAKAFNFLTGKSFFKVFQLPLNATYLNITLDTLIINTAFMPKVDFYNKDRVLISTLKPMAFKYRDSMMGEGKLEAKITINNASAAPGKEFAYMVIYTTEEALKETTSIVHPAVKQAIALGNNVPKLDNLQIPHSPIGELNLAVKFKRDEKDITDDIIEFLDNPLIGGSSTSNREENVVLASGEVYTTSAQSEGTTAVKSVDSQNNLYDPDRVNQPSGSFKMLKETEEMYNKLIVEAVKANNLEKAMQLVAEAQRLGSSTAQQTFIKHIQSK
ncbi:MAG: MalM family protein [Succinivibrionaceae bacterium]